jgi:hypothetical protein
MRRQLFLFFLLLTGVWITFSDLALAQSTGQTTAQSDARTERLLDEGDTLREQGRADLALLKLEQAYALAPQPRVLAQLALTEQALGRFAQAELHLTRVLASTGDAWIEPRRLLLEQTLRTVAGELSSLEVHCNVSGAVVEVDGQQVGKTPLASPLRIAERRATVAVSADGYFPVSQTVELQHGQLQRIELVLLRRTHEAGSLTLAGLRASPGSAGELDAAQSPTAPDTDSTRKQRRWRWAAVASAAVVVVATVLAVSLTRGDEEARDNTGTTGVAVRLPERAAGAPP